MESNATKELKSLEDVFMFVTEHLVTQNECSVSDRKIKECVYRSPLGLKCAVGSLIKDQYYDMGLEGKTACARPVMEAVYYSHPSLTPLNRGDLQKTLEELQQLHDVRDHYKDIETKNELLRLAKELSLNLDLEAFNSLDWDN